MKTKVIIAEAEKNYSEALVKLISANDAFTVCGVFGDGKSVIESLENASADILVLDAFLPQKDALSILSEIDISGISVFIIAPKLYDTLAMLFLKRGVKLIFEKPFDAVSLVRQMCITASLENESILRVETEQRIVHYLKLVSISPKLKGYRYLKSIILNSVESGRRKTYTQLLCELAENCGGSIKNIDRNIRTAIETAWTNGNLKRQYEMFGYTVSPARGRPTNKEFVSMLTQKVRESLAH